MRTKQMIIHNNLTEVKNKILPTFLQRDYRANLGELSNMSDVHCMAFGAERVNIHLKQ